MGDSAIKKPEKIYKKNLKKERRKRKSESYVFSKVCIFAFQRVLCRNFICYFRDFNKEYA